MLLTIVAFVVILGLLVFVHELGHFVAAKKAGCRVEEFGFGFPPRIFGIKKGETIYSINWLPLGGFVKIYGEDGQHVDSKESFAAKKPWVRALILFAGIGMNLILAMVLFAVGYMFGIPQSVPEGGIEGATVRDEQVQVAFVTDGAPADEAGVAVLDRVVSYNGEAVEDVSDLQQVVADSLGEEGVMVVSRGDEQITYTLTPREEYPADEGPLGIELVKSGIVKYPWYQAIWLGVKNTFETFILIVVSIFVLMRDAITTGEFNGDAVSGPVGIAVLTGQFARQGFVYLMWFTAFLSVNLAFINAIPFPALDGGRLLFVGIEKLRRGKKVDQKTENAFHFAGFMLLLLLIVVVTFRDVARFQDSFRALWDNITGLFS